MKKVIDDGLALNPFDHGRCLLSPVQNGRAHSPSLAVSLSLPFCDDLEEKEKITYFKFLRQAVG